MSTKLEETVAELARDLQEKPSKVSVVESHSGLAKLHTLGTKLWLDTGNLEEASKLWRTEMSALTTNNTLANQVVQTGIMDDEIKTAVQKIRKVEPNISEEELIMEVVFVVNCQIALRLVHAFDAFVSVELHPAVSNDLEKTLPTSVPPSS